MEYSVGVMNPGNEELSLRLEAPESREYNLSFSNKKVNLKPSLTEEPEGKGWYYIGKGKYTKVHRIDFDVEISEYRDDNTVEIPLIVRAVPDDFEKDEDNSSKRIGQIRNYRFLAFVDPNLRPKTRENERESSDIFWEEKKASYEDLDLSDNNPNNDSNPNYNIQNDSKSENLEDKKESKSDVKKIDETTFLLIFGIFVMSAYILSRS